MVSANMAKTLAEGEALGRPRVPSRGERSAVASDIGLPLEKGRGADQKAHERAHTATWKRAPGLGGSQNSVQVRADPEKHGGVSEASTSPIPRVQLWLCLSSTHCKSALRRCLGTRQPTTGFLRGAAPPP